MVTYAIQKCSCGDPVCKDWHVAPCANIQGVSLKKWQAQLVADILNCDEEDAPQCRRCGKSANELEETVLGYEDYGVDTPSQMAFEDGTYDPGSNTFICTSCFVGKI